MQVLIYNFPIQQVYWFGVHAMYALGRRKQSKKTKSYYLLQATNHDSHVIFSQEIWEWLDLKFWNLLKKTILAGNTAATQRKNVLHTIVTGLGWGSLV